MAHTITDTPWVDGSNCYILYYSGSSIGSGHSLASLGSTPTINTISGVASASVSPSSLSYDTASIAISTSVSNGAVSVSFTTGTKPNEMPYFEKKSFKLTITTAGGSDNSTTPPTTIHSATSTFTFYVVVIDRAIDLTPAGRSELAVSGLPSIIRSAGGRRYDRAEISGTNVFFDKYDASYVGWEGVPDNPGGMVLVQSDVNIDTGTSLGSVTVDKPINVSVVDTRKYTDQEYLICTDGGADAGVGGSVRIHNVPAGSAPGRLFAENPGNGFYVGTDTSYTDSSGSVHVYTVNRTSAGSMSKPSPKTRCQYYSSSGNDGICNYRGSYGCQYTEGIHEVSSCSKWVLRHNGFTTVATSDVAPPDSLYCPSAGWSGADVTGSNTNIDYNGTPYALSARYKSTTYKSVHGWCTHIDASNSVSGGPHNLEYYLRVNLYNKSFSAWGSYGSSGTNSGPLYITKDTNTGNYAAGIVTCIIDDDNPNVLKDQEGRSLVRPISWAGMLCHPMIPSRFDYAIAIPKDINYPSLGGYATTAGYGTTSGGFGIVVNDHMLPTQDCALLYTYRPRCSALIPYPESGSVGPHNLKVSGKIPGCEVYVYVSYMQKKSGQMANPPIERILNPNTLDNYKYESYLIPSKMDTSIIKKHRLTRPSREFNISIPLDMVTFSRDIPSVFLGFLDISNISWIYQTVQYGATHSASGERPGSDDFILYDGVLYVKTGGDEETGETTWKSVIPLAAIYVKSTLVPDKNTYKKEYIEDISASYALDAYGIPTWVETLYHTHIGATITRGADYTTYYVKGLVSNGKQIDPIPISMGATYVSPDLVPIKFIKPSELIKTYSIDMSYSYSYDKTEHDVGVNNYYGYKNDLTQKSINRGTTLSVTASCSMDWTLMSTDWRTGITSAKISSSISNYTGPSGTATLTRNGSFNGDDSYSLDAKYSVDPFSRGNEPTIAMVHSDALSGMLSFLQYRKDNNKSVDISESDVIGNVSTTISYEGTPKLQLIPSIPSGYISVTTVEDNINPYFGPQDYGEYNLIPHSVPAIPSTVDNNISWTDRNEMYFYTTQEVDNVLPYASEVPGVSTTFNTSISETVTTARSHSALNASCDIHITNTGPSYGTSGLSLYLIPEGKFIFKNSTTASSVVEANDTVVTDGSRDLNVSVTETVEVTIKKEKEESSSSSSMSTYKWEYEASVSLSVLENLPLRNIDALGCVYPFDAPSYNSRNYRAINYSASFYPIVQEESESSSSSSEIDFSSSELFAHGSLYAEDKLMIPKDTIYPGCPEEDYSESTSVSTPIVIPNKAMLSYVDPAINNIVSYQPNTISSAVTSPISFSLNEYSSSSSSGSSSSMISILGDIWSVVLIHTEKIKQDQKRIYEMILRVHNYRTSEYYEIIVGLEHLNKNPPDDWKIDRVENSGTSDMSGDTYAGITLGNLLDGNYIVPDTWYPPDYLLGKCGSFMVFDIQTTNIYDLLYDTIEYLRTVDGSHTNPDNYKGTNSLVTMGGVEYVPGIIKADSSLSTQFINFIHDYDGHEGASYPLNLICIKLDDSSSSSAP